MDEPLKPLDELGEQFERVARAAAGARPRRWRNLRRGRVLGLMVPGLLAAAGVAMAASGILTGAPVRNPAGATFQPTVGVGTPAHARLLDLRVADPGGGPPWGMRTVTTTRGFGCVQIGRVVDGRLGVLGQDGAFGNDGRFHELPADVLTLAYCQQPDGAGHLFIAVGGRSLPASALDRGCAVARPPALPPVLAKRLGSIRPPVAPLCAPADVRILDFGVLGPRATSITYADEDGHTVRARVSQPTGAYLVVRRPSVARPATTQFGVGTSPGTGLRSVRYDGAPRCEITNARRLGGARRCPLVGYVPVRRSPVSAAQVRAPVHAKFAPRPVPPSASPPGIRPPREWRLAITFRARRAGDARSNYAIWIRPRRHAQCDYMTIAPLGRDVRAGEVVRETIFLPATCHGVIRGTVMFRNQSAGPMQQALAPDARGPAAVVGRFEARIPS